MNVKIIGALVLVLAILGGVFLLNSSSEDDASNTANTSEATPATVVQEPVEVVDGTSIAVEMSSYEYSVPAITAEAGESVTINLTVASGRHDFVIDEFDVQSDVLVPGEAQTLEFTIPADTEPGEYEFYCSIGNHRELGMVGTITVL